MSNNVRSAEMSNGQVVGNKIPAPLPRTWIDTTLPGARALLGALFVAFSGYSTVYLFSQDIQRLTGDKVSLMLFADRYWAGLALALLLFFGEIFTSERYPKVYRVLLIPDTFYTARQMVPAALFALTSYAHLVGTTLVVVSWLAALVLGYLIARFGEELIFGGRRKFTQRG